MGGGGGRQHRYNRTFQFRPLQMLPFAQPLALVAPPPRPPSRRFRKRSGPTAEMGQLGPGSNPNHVKMPPEALAVGRRCIAGLPIRWRPYSPFLGSGGGVSCLAIAEGAP